MNLANLAARVGTAVVLVPLIALAILADRPEPVAAIVWLVSLLALAEFFGIALAGAPAWERRLPLALGGALAAALVLTADAELATAALLATVTTLMAAHLGRARDLPTEAARIGVSLLGVLYVPLLLAPIAWLKRRPDGADWVFLALSLTFIGDTAAYFAGHAFGRRKLLPAISPGKTVEGGVGGLAGALAAAAVAKLWYLPQLSWADVPLIALPAGMLGQIGDLCESMFKRGAGVKDSGALLPGHGGMLDRIDALLFVAPYVYLYARFRFGA